MGQGLRLFLRIVLEHKLREMETGQSPLGPEPNPRADVESVAMPDRTGLGLAIGPAE